MDDRQIDDGYGREQGEGNEEQRKTVAGILSMSGEGSISVASLAPTENDSDFSSSSYDDEVMYDVAPVPSPDAFNKRQQSDEDEEGLLSSDFLYETEPSSLRAQTSRRSTDDNPPPATSAIEDIDVTASTTTTTCTTVTSRIGTEGVEQEPVGHCHGHEDFARVARLLDRLLPAEERKVKRGENESPGREDEGVGGIVNTEDDKEDNVALQELGDLCRTLGDMTAPCQELLKARMPRAVVSVMQRLLDCFRAPSGGDSHHGGDAAASVSNAFLPCCYALASYCYNAGVDAQASIGREGGVDAIVAVMRWTSQLSAGDDGDEQCDRDRSLVQQFGCGALGNLLIECEANARLLQRAGGIEAIVGAMEKHPNCSDLNEWALRALNNLCHYEALRRDVVNAGGMTVIRDALLASAPLTASVDEISYCRQWAIEVLSNTVDNLEQ
jgi:hypothetical protein